jgi:ABC-2 type transport system ATP-binding protein
MPSIELNNLTKIYVKEHLLKTTRSTGIENVTLSVEEGEIFGLLGLNGAGKTTTIKLILGLLRPTSGTVTVAGSKVPSSSVLKEIGYLPEVAYFYKYLTAEEILKFYGRLSEIDKLDSRVNEIIDFVGIESVRHKRLSEFSKGMLQRIGIAQSLLHNPGILIYDEPVSGLDPLAIQEMRALIANLKSLGKTVFLSSHLISEVEKVCDRVGILAKGKLVKTIEQHEWAAGPGGLEKMFVAEVAGSAELGKMNFQYQTTANKGNI